MRGFFCSLVLSGGAFLAGDDAKDEFDVGAGDWSASAGTGYRKNVLLSEIAPIDSSFNYLSFEGIAQKEFIATGAQWTTMGLVENRHYFEGDDLPDETFGLVLSEYSRFVGIDGTFKGGFQYLYFNQAFDATFDILDPNQVVITAQEPRLYAEWESFLWQFEYSAAVGVSRMYFQDASDDYETVDWEIGLDYALDDRSRWLFAVDGFARDYTDRPTRNADGLRVDSIPLGTDQIGLETSVERGFGSESLPLLAEIGIDYEERRDRHFGYYDRDRTKYFLELRAGGEKWRMRLDVGYSERDYRTQTAVDGFLRSSDEWVGSLEWERDLSQKWAFLARGETDSSESNETFFSYDTNSLMLGIRLK